MATKIKAIDFDVRDNRLMVSLGPLTSKKLCTFSCAFCYTFAAEFVPFNGLSVPEILDWIHLRKKDYDIIYVSGDTDSFAPPRTDEGVDLLSELSLLDNDILFTTRALFSDECLLRISNINETLRSAGKHLIGCVSVSQLNNHDLEPWPVPTPSERLDQLKRFKELGLVSVLAMRPFLPVVPVEDYLKIVSLASGFADVILGGDWYLDKTGVLESRVFNKGSATLKYGEGKMDFIENDAVWNIYHDEETQKIIRSHCEQLGIPFFVRSGPAVSWIRDNIC